jgi:transposase
MGQDDVSSHKKGARQIGAAVVFADEASFRQDPTLFRTWARRGQQPHVPTYGERNTQHVLGAVSLTGGRFTYRFAPTLNGDSYLTFLRQLVRVFAPQPVRLIADNARYHKHPDVLEWCRTHSDELRLWFLPPYCPELNAMERVWGHVRRRATHNRFFENVPELLGSLRSGFGTIQRRPQSIQGYLAPYQ